MLGLVAANAHLAATAASIEAVTTVREERAALVTLGFYESHLTVSVDTRQ